MIAYLIDPGAQEVREVEYNGDYKHIYRLIDCQCFDVVRVNNHGDGIFLDDEGYITNGIKSTFMWLGINHVLVGKGLLLGVDNQGESVSPRMSLEAVRNSVVWTGDIKVGV